MNGTAGVASLGVAVGRGARADAVARTLTVIQLGRELLHEIETGTAAVFSRDGLIHALYEAGCRAENFGAVQAA